MAEPANPNLNPCRYPGRFSAKVFHRFNFRISSAGRDKSLAIGVLTLHCYALNLWVGLRISVLLFRRSESFSLLSPRVKMSSSTIRLDGPSASRRAKRRRSGENDQPQRNLTLGRRCFVTIGATAGFRQLLVEILQPEFLQCLGSYGYDILDVQCGPDHEWFQSQAAKLTNTYGIAIRQFNYTDNMQSHMLECRGEVDRRLPGCIISHAGKRFLQSLHNLLFRATSANHPHPGSGTILEALRYQAPLVVVPNPTLMDNHQAELAEECEQQNWGIYGKLGYIPTAAIFNPRNLVTDK